MLGASHSELALVGMLFLMVLVAPKIPRIGEWIGARFERGPADPVAPASRPPRGAPPPDAPSSPPEDAGGGDGQPRGG